MSAVGVFAGRGDVILGMGLALLVGFWAGWQIKGLMVWLKNRRAEN
jgi:hypothetical protein